MVRTTIETRVLSVYLGGGLSNALSISEIARRINAAYPHAHAAITDMITTEMLVSYTIGRTILCAPNLKNDLTRALLCEAEAERKKQFLSTPNKQNLHAEIQELAVQHPGLIAVLLQEDQLHFLVTDERQAHEILKDTPLQFSFSTPKKYFSTIKNSEKPFKNTLVLVGYDRLLLLLSPIREQLMLNHSSFREVEHE